jgi:hypothetical protein
MDEDKSTKSKNIIPIAPIDSSGSQNLEFIFEGLEYVFCGDYTHDGNFISRREPLETLVEFEKMMLEDDVITPAIKDAWNKPYGLIGTTSSNDTVTTPKRSRPTTLISNTTKKEQPEIQRINQHKKMKTQHVDSGLREWMMRQFFVAHTETDIASVTQNITLHMERNTFANAHDWEREPVVLPIYLVDRYKSSKESYMLESYMYESMHVTSLEGGKWYM